MKKIFSHQSYQPAIVLAALRVLVGAFMIYHGWEIFDDKKMADYDQWMNDVKFMFPLVAHVGKAGELVGGILLTTGFLTRVGALVLISVMSAITFGLGNGKIFTEDQHPFLFVVFGLMFFFLGGGDFSLDKKFF